MYKMNLLSVKLGLLLHLFSVSVCGPTVYIINTSGTLCMNDDPCFTFEQFAANTSQRVRNQTILQLNPGYHSFSSRLNVENTHMFSITSESKKGIVNCCSSRFAGFNFSNVKMVNISNITVIGCGGSNAVINFFQSILDINGCIFTHSKGMIIFARCGTLIVKHSIFKHSYAGVITAKSNSNISVADSIFEFNNLTSKRAVLYVKSSNGILKKCMFHNSTANSNTDIIHVERSILMLEQCELTNNSAKKGKIVKLIDNSIITITDTHFMHNSLRTGMLSVEYSNLTIDNCTFMNNTVTKVGVLYIRRSKTEIQRLEMRGNTAEWGVLHMHYSEVKASQNIRVISNNAILSTIDIRKSTLELNGGLEFSQNIGNIFIEESKVVFNGPSIFCDNEQKQHTNTSLYEQGGAITCIWSAIYFNSATKFCRNKSWKVGGAINVIESKIYAHSDATYSENMADKGGAVHLDHSYFICQSNCSFIGNKALSKGGAIHAIDSVISIGYEWYNIQKTSNLPRLLSFVDNYAEGVGGGISLEANAKVLGPLNSEYTYIIKFINNTAQNGAAIYVNDYGTCSSARYSTCFLQTPLFKRENRNSLVIINSTDNKNAI